MLLQGVFWADFWIYISFPKESFSGAEKNRGILTPFPGVSGGGHWKPDVGSRTQRTGDLFPSSAESSSTRYDARTAGR